MTMRMRITTMIMMLMKIMMTVTMIMMMMMMIAIMKWLWGYWWHNLEDFFAEEHFAVYKDSSQLSELERNISCWWQSKSWKLLSSVLALSAELSSSSLLYHSPSLSTDHQLCESWGRLEQVEAFREHFNKLSLVHFHRIILVCHHLHPHHCHHLFVLIIIGNLNIRHIATKGKSPSVANHNVTLFWIILMMRMLIKNAIKEDEGYPFEKDI